MDENLKGFVFEVETTYKSGKTRSDYIAAGTEEEVWEYYDKHHDSKKVEWCAIVDSWIQ